jgi:alkylation response protein AidB-like acyl-CoA dehydrogenase
MAQYRTDLRDINFNLFELLKVHESGSEFGEQDLKEIVSQFDYFTGQEIYPTRIVGDEKGVQLKDGAVTVPEEFHKANQAFYENGWFALGYPEDIGGMMVPWAVTFACKSIGIGSNVAFSMYNGLTAGALNVINKIGSDEQKAKYVAPIMEGRWGGTMCLTESGAGSDVGNCITTAVPNDDGTYNIKGVKIFISSGDNDLYENIVHLVLARTPGAPEGTKGISLFTVPKLNDDQSVNNVVCTKIEEKMGIHASATCELTFGGNGECKGQLIGKEFEGMANMFIMMNEARLLCALQGEGQANLVTNLTEQYAIERSQFGTEIVNLPDVKRMLLRMRAYSRGMRSLCLYTGNLFDAEDKGDEEAAKEIAFLIPICKGFCTDEGFNVSVEAIQVHGGYGFCSEYGIEQFARDTKIGTIYEGTNGIQAIDFVMRKNLRENGETFKKVEAKINASIKAADQVGLKDELTYLGSYLGNASKMLEHFAKLAAAKKMNTILESATDFLNYSGHLIVAWRLLDAANLAHAELKTASGDDKAFYETKVADFKVFCKHCLTKQGGIVSSVLEFEEDISAFQV